jgi:DNA-damage-inducible protein D
MNDIIKYDAESFESIKRINEDGEEFWYAGELQKVLVHARWRKLEGFIEKARISCGQRYNIVGDYFADVRKTIEVPKNKLKQVKK